MSSDDKYTASAERVFGDAVVSVSVYPGVPHARVSGDYISVDRPSHGFDLDLA